MSMSMLFLGLSLVAAAPPIHHPLSADVGTDATFAVRIAWGELQQEASNTFAALEALFSAVPQQAHLAHTWQKRLSSWLKGVESITGAKLDSASTVLTLFVDSDATGGVVWWAFLRNANAKPQDKQRALREFTIDTHPAFWPEGERWGFSRHGDTWVLGNRRGLQRGVRQLQTSNAAGGVLAGHAQRLRSADPVQGAFKMSANLERELAPWLGEYGALLKSMDGGSFSAGSQGIQLVVDTSHKKHQEAVTLGMESAVAWLRAQGAALHAAVKLAQSLKALGRSPHNAPQSTEFDDNISKGLNHFARWEVRETIAKRPSNIVEVSAKVSHYSPLWGALLLALGGRGPQLVTESLEAEAQKLLLLLRRAQFAAKRRDGHFVPCGPTPQSIPHGVVDRPREGCFAMIEALLSGWDVGAVRFQLEATTHEGTLALLARTIGREGVAQVWWLDETASDAQRVGVQP